MSNLINKYYNNIEELNFNKKANIKLKKIDLNVMAENSINYLKNNPDPAHNYDSRFCWFLTRCLPLVLYRFDNKPIDKDEVLDPIAVGDTESRNDIAWNLMQEITGNTDSNDIKETVHSRLRGYLKNDGFAWVKPYCMSSDVDSEAGMQWTTGILLQSETDRFRITGDAESRRFARKIYEGIKAKLEEDTGRFYYPFGASAFRDGKRIQGYEDHYHILIKGVLEYSKVFHDEEALNLAKAMGDGIIAGLQTNLLSNDMYLAGHSHVQMHSLKSIAMLGAYTKEYRYTDFAKTVFSRSFSNELLDTGYIPEARDSHVNDHTNHTETCLTADIMEFFLYMADTGLPEYYDIADRIFRNAIIPMQFKITDEFIKLFNDINKTCSKEDMKRSFELFLLLEGGFISAMTPNDLVFEVMDNCVHVGSSNYNGKDIVMDMMGCCPPQGMQAIWHIWNHVVQYADSQVKINLYYDRDSDYARIETDMPNKGYLKVTAKMEADYLLRCPIYTDRNKIKLSVNGKIIQKIWGGPGFNYITVKDIRAKDIIEFEWPLPNFKQKQFIAAATHHPESEYEFEWLGNTVVNVSPPAKYLPVYGANSL